MEAQYGLIAFCIICILFSVIIYALYIDLKNKSDIKALKDKMEIDALKKELNVYKRYNKEIPYTTEKELNIHP